MNFVILFMALLWAVAADKEAVNRPHLRRRELSDCEMCLDVDRVGDVTVDVDRNCRWFLQRSGSDKGECPNETSRRINRRERSPAAFCRRINRKYYQLYAPLITADWLEGEGWERGSCRDEFGENPDEFIEMTYTGTSTSRRGYKRVGERCNHSPECQSGNCDDHTGLCEERYDGIRGLSLGDHCHEDDECSSGNCDNGRCERGRRGDSDRCNRSWQCGSDEECRGGRCRRIDNGDSCADGERAGRQEVQNSYSGDCADSFGLERSLRSIDRKFRDNRYSNWTTRTYNRCALEGAGAEVQRIKKTCMYDDTSQCNKLGEAAADIIAQAWCPNPESYAYSDSRPGRRDYEEMCRELAYDICEGLVPGTISDRCNESLNMRNLRREQAKCTSTVDELLGL